MPGSTSDPFYKSTEWRKLCVSVRKRARGRCEVPGCGCPGRIVDHIVSRRNGGSNHPHNLRLLCDVHDKQVKELPSGNRRNQGEFRLGVAENGRPKDPNHPWNSKNGLARVH